jgi:hypothetical protein
MAFMRKPSPAHHHPRGPLVNIVFALLAFAFLWMSGGRDNRFSEFTHRDRLGRSYKSALYEKEFVPAI